MSIPVIIICMSIALFLIWPFILIVKAVVLLIVELFTNRIENKQARWSRRKKMFNLFATGTGIGFLQVFVFNLFTGRNTNQDMGWLVASILCYILSRRAREKELAEIEKHQKFS